MAAVHIGEQLRQLRVVQKRSQEAVAAEAGVSHTTISNIERGKATAFIGTVASIAAVLGHEVALVPKGGTR